MVIEFDEDEYADNDGFGHIGRLTDPFGADVMVAWLDGEHSGIRRSQILLPKQPGSTFELDGVPHIVDRYTDTGVILTVDYGDADKRTARRTNTRSRASSTTTAKRKQVTSAPVSPETARPKQKRLKKTPTKTPTKTPKKTPKKTPTPASPKKTPASPKNTPAAGRTRAARARKTKKKLAELPVQKVAYKYQDPLTMEMIPTEVNVPGFAFDTIFKRTVYVLAVDTSAKAYFFLDSDDHPRRSREHLRACTHKEFKTASLARNTSNTVAQKDKEAKKNKGSQKKKGAQKGKDAQKDKDEEVDNQCKAPTSWAPFKNQAQLTPACQQIMMDELEDLVEDTEPETFYLFVERVARVYINSRRTTPEEDLHEDRDYALYCAIKVSQVRTDRFSIRTDVRYFKVRDLSKSVRTRFRSVRTCEFYVRTDLPQVRTDMKFASPYGSKIDPYGLAQIPHLEITDIRTDRKSICTDLTYLDRAVERMVAVFMQIFLG